MGLFIDFLIECTFKNMGFYMNIALFPPLLGLIGMIAAFVVYMLVMKYPDGEDKVKKLVTRFILAH